VNAKKHRLAVKLIGGAAHGHERRYPPKAIDLLKLIAWGEEDVSAGKLTEQDSLFDCLETKLKAKKASKQAEK